MSENRSRLDLNLDPARLGSRGAENSDRTHRFCIECNRGGMILGGSLLGIGAFVLLVTCVQGIGGGSILWDPEIRYHGRILGAVSSVVGVVLIFICHQVRDLDLDLHRSLVLDRSINIEIQTQRKR